MAKDNDANHDGVFSDTENVPTNATYPWVVTYRLTLSAGTFSHRIAAIGDDLTSTLTSTLSSPSCATLVGTTIAAATSEVCYYDVTLARALSAPLMNTATITWDSGGADATSNTSVVLPTLGVPVLQSWPIRRARTLLRSVTGTERTRTPCCFRQYSVT